MNQVRVAKRRGARWVLTTLAMIAVVVVAFLGFRLLAGGHAGPSAAHRIAEAATVAGFERKALIDVQEKYSDPLISKAYFIGPPPVPDFSTAIWVQFISLPWKDSPWPEWNLTTADLSGVKSGSRVLISLDVTRCGWW